MDIVTTPRLRIRHFTINDAPFVMELVNDPDWLRYIGDRNVRSIDDARAYVERAIDSYARQGFGLYVVVTRDTGVAAGIAGFVRRSGLDAPDLGFAFLPAARGQGFALEACRALLGKAASLLQSAGPSERNECAEPVATGIRILAVTTTNNGASVRLLEKLGFQGMGQVLLPGAETPLLLFETVRSDG